MSLKSETQGICWLCLKRFDLASVNISPTSKLGFNVSSGPDSSKDGDCYDIYTRFLHLSSRYLKLPITTELFIKAAKDHKDLTGGNITAFCGSCQDFVGRICDLYAELEAVKLRLAGRLEEVEEMLISGRKRVSSPLYRGLLKILMEQMGVNSMNTVKRFRMMVQTKCKAKAKEAAPKPLVPRGLFPEHWKVGYPACQRMMMRLIVVFLLASERDSSGKMKTVVNSQDPDGNEAVAPEKVRRRRVRRPKSKNSTTLNILDNIKNNEDLSNEQKIVTKLESNESIVDDTDNLVKTEVDLANLGDGEPFDIDIDLLLDSTGNDNDSDCRGAASPMSVDADPPPPEAVPEPDILKIEEPPAPKKQRWNLRTRKNRKPITFSESGSDLDLDKNDSDSDYNQDDDEVAKIDEEDLEIADVDEKDQDQEMTPKTVEIEDISNPFFPNSETTNTNPKTKAKHSRGRGWSLATKPTLPCPKCKKLFLDKRCLGSHLTQIHNTHLTHTCVTCGEKFIRWKDLRNHKRQVHRKTKGPKNWTKKPRSCLICSKVFPTITKLDEHKRQANHFGSRCPDPNCDLVFFTKRELKEHLVQKHPSILEEEDDDDLDLSDDHIEKKERRLGNPGKETKCTKCDLVFRTFNEMLSHRKMAHPRVVSSISLTFKHRDYVKCPENNCDFRGNSHETSVHLVKVHGQGEMLSCDKCDKEFPNVYHLRYHKENNHKEKKFMCDICGKMYSKPQFVDRHRVRHDKNREKSYICPICGMSFLTETGIRYHTWGKHTDNKDLKHQCNFCGKGYGRKHLLTAHKKNCAKLHVNEVNEEETAVTMDLSAKQSGSSAGGDVQLQGHGQQLIDQSGPLKPAMTYQEWMNATIAGIGDGKSIPPPTSTSLMDHQ